MGTHLIAGRLVAGGGLAAGRITVRELLPKSLAVELTLNRAESIDADILLPLTDPMTGVTVNLPEDVVPGRDFVGVMVDGTLMAAGPLWADPYTTGTRTLSWHAGGLWSYFDRRLVLPVLHGRLPRDVTSQWSGLSLRTIAKRLVQQAISHPGAGLPIDFEPDAPGDHERTYPGSDDMSVGEALANLTEVEGGPDIDFRPYLTEDRMHVRWRMVTGTLTQDGGAHYWDVSAATPYAVSPSLDRDGRELASRQFISGTTKRNEIRDGEFREGLNGAQAGGANGTITDMPPGAVERALGAQGYSLTTWSGNSSLGNGGVSFAGRPVTVEPGQRFAVSCMAQGTPKPVRLMMQFTRENETVGTVQLAAGTLTGAYQKFAATWVVPADVVKAGLFLYPQATQQFTAGNTLRTTMWSMVETTEPLPYFYDELELQAIAENPLLTAAGYPLLESWEARPSVLRTSTLQAYADEGVMRGSAHITTRPIIAQRDQHPKLGSYRPGDYVRVRRGTSPREPEGTDTERIIRISFTASGPVSIDTAPQRTTGYPVPSSDRAWLGDQLRRLNARIRQAERR